jgi:Dolichyl-phosphate-mannose-protein mannosyltransferase
MENSLPNHRSEESTRRNLLHRAADLLPRDDWLVVGWILAIRFLLFVLGATNFRVLENKPVPTVSAVLGLFNRWDADQYLRLAQFGYTPTSVWKAWLYPLYPWCVRFAAWIVGNYLVSALLVSLIALLLGALLLRRLVEMDFGREIALRTVWFFLIFPTAYFLHAPYTESLFLALAIACILAARKQRWWLSGVLGALCWMTRPTGIVLLPALAVEAAHQFWTTRRWNWRWLWIAVVPFGFGVYLLLNWKISGSPFAFLAARKGLFSMSGSWPWVAMRGSLGIWREWAPNKAEMNGAQEFYFAALTLICTVAAWIKLRPSYAVWMTGNWLLVVSVTFLLSMPRYALTMFPMFILFALVGSNRFWNGVLTIWSLAFFALFASYFTHGWWAF